MNPYENPYQSDYPIALGGFAEDATNFFILDQNTLNWALFGAVTGSLIAKRNLATGISVGYLVGYLIGRTGINLVKG